MGDGKGNIKSQVIRAQTKENTSGVSLKMKKPIAIENMNYFEKFEINLFDNFNIQGQGIDINYPLTNSKRLTPYFYLEADTQ
jgi:hypothetical protein